MFTNANDRTNEGLVHDSKRVFSVQFHPEHNAGPEDLECLFDVFLELIKDEGLSAKEAIDRQLKSKSVQAEPEEQNPHKVLVLGSGGLSIGQAGEFFSFCSDTIGLDNLSNARYCTPCICYSNIQSTFYRLN